jgi:hypothetical protein
LPEVITSVEDYQQEGRPPLIPYSNLIRWGGIGFMLGGVAWIVSGFLIVSGHSMLGPHLLYFLSCLVALPLTFAGFVGLHSLQEGHYGSIGVIGLCVLLLALMLQAVDMASWLVGDTILVLMIYPAELVGKLVGFVLYGVATLQAGVLPRWYGIALITLVPISLTLLAYGNLWMGLVLLVLGYVLLWQKDLRGS